MPDEVIDIELKNSEDKKSREERKANGRFAAVIIAVVIILLAIYHAWIRKTAVLAGILVPALIMILYGGWVVFLAKRDKKRRLLMTRQMEENARIELAKQMSITTLKRTNEKRKNTLANNENSSDNKENLNKNNVGKHRKRKHKRSRPNYIALGPNKRPSFRQRLFRNAQNDAFIRRKGRLSRNNLQLPPYLCRTNSAP